MQKNRLNLYSTEGMSRPEWLDFRQEFLGGSDAGTVMGLNKRYSAVELFYQKIGMTFSNQEKTNPAMAWGQMLEDKVRHAAQFYDFETGEYLDNLTEGKKLRDIVTFTHMVNNPKYPWMLANVDGLENFNPETFIAESICECKTISRQSAEMWSTIPIYALIQVQFYMTVLEPMLTADYGDIYYLQDGREFTGWRLPKSSTIIESMLEQTESFWGKVLKGREIMAATQDYDKRLKFLAQIEPDPVPTQAYSKFLSELHQKKSNFIKIEGTDADLDHAINFKLLSRQIDALEEKKMEHQNHLKKVMHDNSANILDFAKSGKVTFNKKFYVNIKE